MITQNCPELNLDEEDLTRKDKKFKLAIFFCVYYIQ